MIPLRAQGLLLLLLSLLSTYLVSANTSLKPVANYGQPFEYLPLLTANLYADLLIIVVTFSAVLGSGKSWDVLQEWYKKYRLSAMLADILIGVLYLMAARYLSHILKLELDLFQFALLAVAIQILCDYGFYLFFTSVPKGSNHMLDFFKDWSRHAKLDALWGDSILVLFAVVLSAYFNQQSLDSNISYLVLGLYLTPYIIHMKD